MAVETLLDLLRHGAVAGGARLRGARTDDPLDEAGWQQLDAATRHDPGWELIASSPSARCLAFAEAFAERTGIELEVDERLREYDFGDWDGRPLDELWHEQGDALARFLGDSDTLTPPGGEPAADFRARARAARDDLLDRHAGRHLLLLAHGGVLRQLVADALGAPGLHHALEWPPAAISRIRVIDDPPHPRSQSLAWHARPTADAAG